MIDETEDFATFEAAANAPEEAVETPKPEDEAPEVKEPEEGAEEAPEGEEEPEDGEAEEPKRRSRPASQRIAELTARNHALQRQLEAREEPKPAEAAPDKPNPDDFEFGEADPGYIDKLTDWKLDTRERERAKASEATRVQQDMTDKITTGVAKAETAAKAKYDDFDAKIAEAVETRGGEPLPPLLTIGIGVSPVGGDIIYRLATDQAASSKLERLAKGGAQTANAMAQAFGELEGEYLTDDSDDDLDIADQLDMARMLGRMRARMKGKPAPKLVATNAPEPPEQRARGGAGRFEVSGDTTDFAAFERKANGAK